MAALARLNKAVAQVPDKVHSSRKNRATETLYVGNLAFNTTEEDLSEALEYCLGTSIVVKKITIPCVNGKSKFCFIELSWAQAAMIDIADIMRVHSSEIVKPFTPPKNSMEKTVQQPRDTGGYK